MIPIFFLFCFEGVKENNFENSILNYKDFNFMKTFLFKILENLHNSKWILFLICQNVHLRM